MAGPWSTDPPPSRPAPIRPARHPTDTPVINRSLTARCVLDSVPGHALHKKVYRDNKASVHRSAAGNEECFSSR